MCDAHLYAPLLGGTEPEIDTALELVAALLSHLTGRPCAPETGALAAGSAHLCWGVVRLAVQDAGFLLLELGLG